MSSQTNEGWGKSPVSRKWHFFAADGRSLCGKIGFYFGPKEPGQDDSPDNCAECRKRLKKEIPKASVPQGE